MDKVINKLIKKHKTNCPYKLADRLNINVWFEDLGTGTRGIYHKILRRRYIVINQRLDEDWRRFVCAHELGHDRLHPGLSRFMLDTHSFTNVGKYERQANRFAVQLLTAGDEIESGETVVDLLTRNNVPLEMQRFYY